MERGYFHSASKVSAGSCRSEEMSLQGQVGPGRQAGGARVEITMTVRPPSHTYVLRRPLTTARCEVLAEVCSTERGCGIYVCPPGLFEE